MKWSDVIGQQTVKERLIEMVRAERVPHALLLAGETGYGSLALAMALASTLLCQGNSKPKQVEDAGFFGMMEPEEPQQEATDDAIITEACGECPQCKMLRDWHHPDLYFSFPTIKGKNMSGDHKPVSNDYSSQWNELICDAGPYITLDQWMTAMKADNQQSLFTAAESDEISRRVALTSSQGGYKVIIMWLAERMNEECANKILKTLEEPAKMTVFILVCEQPELMLETIRSRVQRIDVPRIDTESLKQALIDRRKLDADIAYRLARASDGNWLKAIEQLEVDSESRLFLDLFKQLMRMVYAKDVRGMKKWCDTVSDSKFGREKQRRLLSYFLRMIREAFMSNFKEPDLNYMTLEEEQFVQNFGRFINEANVIEITELLELALRDIRQNTNQKIVFFDTALRLTQLLLRK